MKTLINAIVAGLLVFGSQAAFAEGPTPESSLLNGAQIVRNARVDQSVRCELPLKNTSAQCRSDFEAFIQAEIELTARHVLYLKEGDKKKAAQLKKELDPLAAKVHELAQRIDQYIPRATGSLQ
jgi:hypothetical protein